MEKTLFLEATEDTPRIELDAGKGLFEISGCSMPEDAKTFYEPVINWFGEYLLSPNPATTLSLKLDYYNSSTARQLVALFILLEDANAGKSKVSVKWFCDRNDELIRDRGMEMKEMTSLPLEIIEQ